jgi:phosphoribosylformylglycinamidine synthase
MTAYQVMLSESQERMLVVVERGREAEVNRIFEKWDLEAAVVGEVTDDRQLTVVEQGLEVATLPVQLLTDGAPARSLEGSPRPEQATIISLDRLLGEPDDVGKVLERLLASPNLCSRRPVFRRYDHMVGNATVGPPGGDAAMIRVQGTPLGLALTIDGNGRYCGLDPYVGAQIAVCEAARNIVATGARPLAVTDCLNFANPDRAEVYWDLEQAVAGIAAACQALGLPVVSGNVSLYNESEPSGAIYPTPVIGMVGVLEDYATRLPAGLRDAGDFVLLIGETHNDLGGSEYMKVVHREVAGRPPGVDLNRERATQDFILEAHEAGLLRSAHDVAEGGMLVALAECCLLGGVGVRCPALRPEDDLRLDSQFFGESQGRFIVSAAPRAVPELQGMARRHHVEMLLLGLSGGDSIEFEEQFQVQLDGLRRAWEGGL